MSVLARWIYGDTHLFLEGMLSEAVKGICFWVNGLDMKFYFRIFCWGGFAET